MFRKFLIFAGFLLTFASSQNGYATITMDPPKAVLQRGSYSKVRLTFILNNITPTDAQTYEMGALETDDGIRSLTKYLDICINEVANKKCVQGLDPLKVRYLNATYDTTPEQELSQEYIASFVNGSPRFERLENDTTGTYRRLEVAMDITATGSKKFSTDTYIALRLLPGTATTSSNFLDQEVKPTLAVAASDVVETFEVRSSKNTLTAIWDTNEQISRADGSMSPPDGAIAFVVEEDKWDDQSIPLHTYNEADPGAETKIPNACRILRDGETNNCTVDCPGIAATDDHYLKVDDLNEANINVIESSGNTGNISLTDLDNDITYAVVLQNQPDGLQRSCKIAKPSDAVTLTELGGGPEPVVKDPRCFIATAAYGSPLDPHLNTLRWFRDNVLLVTGIGQKFVQAYYSYSPPLAQFIAAHPTLRTLTRGVLWLPVILIEFWRERPSLLLTLSAMSGTFLLLFLRRRSLRASV